MVIRLFASFVMLSIPRPALASEEKFSPRHSRIPYLNLQNAFEEDLFGKSYDRASRLMDPGKFVRTTPSRFTSSMQRRDF